MNLLTTNTKALNNCRYIVAGLLALLLTCCNNEQADRADEDAPNVLKHVNEQLPLNEFISWTVNEENGLAKMKKINDIDFKIAYLTAPQLAYMELKGRPYSKEEFEQTLQNYTSMTYFNFRVELNGGSGELLKYQLHSAQQYDQRINYMAFGMEKDICLVQGTDTLNPGMYHFERIYDVAPYATVMLAFDNKKFDKTKAFSVIYNDRLFNKGYIKYMYKSNQLIDLPNLSGI